MRGALTEIRQQLRNQSLEDLLSTSIKTVGGRIFPDDLAVIDMDALNQIVSTWRSTHVPTYGQVLPNSGVIAEGIQDGGGIAPSDNEVIEIAAVALANTGATDAIEVQMSIGDLPLGLFPVPPLETATLAQNGIFPLTLSKGLSLKFNVVTGTGSDFEGSAAYQFRCR